MDTDAAAGFAAGDTEADEGHDDDGKGVEEALVKLDFGGHDGGGAPHFFAYDIVVEFHGVHGGDVVVGPVEVVGGDAQVALRLPTAGKVFAVAVDGAVYKVEAVPFAGEGVVLNAGAGDAVYQLVLVVVNVAVELVDAKSLGIEALGIYLCAMLGLEVNVAEVVLLASVDVVAFELGKAPVVDGDDEVAEDKHYQRHDGRAVEVGPHESPVADAAAEDGDDLGVAGHLGGEKDDADEDEERTVEVDEAGDEVEVVAINNLPQRRMAAEEVVEFFRYIECDDDDYDERHRHEEGLQVLQQDVPVKFWH